MLRNLGIRWQILSALTLPVLVLALVAGQATYTSYRDMRQADEALDLSSAAASFTRLITGLSGERLLTVAAMAGAPGAEAQLKSVRGQIDGGVQQLRALIYRTDDSPYNDEERAILERVSAAHDTIPEIRKLADSGKATPEQVEARYDEIIELDLRVPSDIGKILDDNEVQRNFARYSDLGFAIESLSHEQLIGLEIALSRRPTLAQQKALAAAGEAAAFWLAEFDRTALPDQRQFMTTALAKVSAQTKSYGSMKAKISAAGTRRASGVVGTLWTASTQARIEALNTVLDKVALDGTAIAQRAHDDARRAVQLTAGGALVAVLLMLVVALTLSRRISRPLRRLTAAATQVRDELPAIVAHVQADDAVDIALPTVASGGRNEVERLASAFTDVNAVTLRIAREQAVLRAAVAGMFVNVARRNQTLLSRQLSFIDHLERTEENPDSLENLFRLDHLAARMRRNAESLLVLAGVESGRRLRNAMPLSDVVRTATSEIEHYDRISLVFQADPPVYPHLALPTAHLLAELLENATNFSDPGSEVIVATAGHADGVRLTITDAGLGMTDEELEEANARIAEPPASEGIGSQRLGFFVVGRLARRLEARVTLRGGRARGTVVTVELPASLFESGSLAGLAPATEELAAPSPAPALAGTGAAPAQPATQGAHAAPPAPAAAAATATSLPRRGAPAAHAAAPAAPAPALPIPAPGGPVEPAPTPAPEPEPAPTGWSPVVPEAWAPLPAQTGPGYSPEVAAGPVPERSEQPDPPQPFGIPGTTGTAGTVETAAVADGGTAVAEAAAPADVAGTDAPTGGRPALFSGFRSRRESPADQAPPVPPLPPAMPEPGDVASPWAPQAYESGPAPVAGPAAETVAPSAPPPAAVPVVPPAEPYQPSLPPALAAAVWSPPPPMAQQPPAGAPVDGEGAYPLRRQPSSIPLEPPAALRTPVAVPPVAPESAPWAPPVPAGEAAPEAAGDLPVTEDDDPVTAPRLGAGGPMDVLPARRGRPALRRPKKPATASHPAPEGAPEARIPAQATEPRTPAPVPADAAAEWAALADAPAGTSPAPLPVESRTVAEPVPVGAPRSAIASEALTELSRLSSYSPASVQDEGRPSLRRRTPAPPPAEPEPMPDLGEAGQRARTAANVRTMLAGFKAGVERGRTSPSAHRPAPRVSDAGVPPQRHVPGDGDA